MKPPWHMNIADYGVDDADLMREIVIKAGVPERIQVTRKGDARAGAEGFRLVDPETAHATDPDWLVRIHQDTGMDFGDYLRGFVRRYMGESESWAYSSQSRSPRR